MKKKKSPPKISVIIRAYNAANFVGQAIASAIRQAISPELYEVLVIDDGSTDGTAEILKAYQDKIRVVRLPHLGNHIKTLNRGLSQAKGEYVVILDADDLFLPETLGAMLPILEEDQKADFVCSHYYERDLARNREKIISWQDDIFKGIAAGTLFRKKMLEELGLYDENLIFPEYDLLLKARGKYRGVYLERPLYIYQRHKNSITADPAKVKLGREQLFKKYGKTKVQ